MMLIRCVLIYELRNYFIGKTYGNKYYLVKKNEFNTHFKKGGDYNFYCNRINKLLLSILVPLDEEEVIRENMLARC